MSIESDGTEGEKAFNAWLRRERLPYVEISQARDSFSTLFAKDIKRPDFLLLLASVGLLAIDVKNKRISGSEVTLDVENELKRSLMFERLFRLPLWYAYCDRNNFGNSWYWISALKAFEVGKDRAGPNGKFKAISLKHFEEIADASHLAKLYTHRLPSVRKLASFFR